MIGVTSSQFINKMEKNAIKRDQDIIGISEEKFSETACKKPTISATLKDFKDIGMTEFGLGWSGRMLIQANLEARIESLKGLVDMLGGLKMCKSGTQRELKARDEKKLEYIG
jgi:hypothetical protein